MGRYDRQLLELTEEEQSRISGSSAGIAGCGGLGTTVATALASAGVSAFVLMDPDIPDETNLNRQFAYCEEVLSGNPRPKAVILADWIKKINPSAEVRCYAEKFSAETSHLFGGCTVMIDCLDSIRDRLELNRYCVSAMKPLVHGSINGFDGEVMTVIPGTTPCLSCVLENVPDSGSAPASLGPVVMAVASMEAAEALKIITGRGKASGFVSYDFLNCRCVPVNFERRSDCPVCGRLK